MLAANNVFYDFFHFSIIPVLKSISQIPKFIVFGNQQYAIFLKANRRYRKSEYLHTDSLRAAFLRVAFSGKRL